MRIEEFRFEDRFGIPYAPKSAAYADVCLRIPDLPKHGPYSPPGFPLVYRDPKGLWLPLSLAIAFDQPGGGAFDNVASITWSHNCTSGDFLVVHMANHNSTADSITGVTFDGVSMTKLVSGVTSANVTLDSSLWYLVVTAGHRGTHNIVATHTGAGLWIFESASWNGVDQSSPIGNTVLGHQVTGSGTTFTEALTTATSGSSVILGSWSQEAADFASGSNTTVRKQTGSGLGSGIIEMVAAGTGAQAPVTNCTATFILSILFEMKASGGGGGGGVSFVSLERHLRGVTRGVYGN